MNASKLALVGLCAAALFAVSAGSAQAAGQQSPRAHANGEHPAVVVARLAQHPAVDANQFRVQPPAAVTWTLHSAAETTTVAAVPATSLAQ